MYFRYMAIGLLIWSCGSNEATNDPISSDSNQHFEIVFESPEQLNQLLKDSLIYGTDCEVVATSIGNKTALQITTTSEFSDAFVDLQQLFGYPINFAEAKYLSVHLYVPKESWISTLKFNFRDSSGNFGGFQEIFNNFYDHTDQWINMVVDLDEVRPDFQNWSGDRSPLPYTTLLTFNPYNAHQAAHSSIYIHSLTLSAEKPEGDFLPRLAISATSDTNVPYEINFDDEQLLRQHTAFRSFESSFQALAKGVADNPTMAIRIKGNDENKHIAFLPILDKTTGQAVDFTQVEEIYFPYYLTPESDDFDGSLLYLTSEHWDDILLDTTFYSDYQKGSWEEVVIKMNDLNLVRVKGENPVLPNVYELRLDINYFPERKNIEMWIDDFGWR
ncbi:MAG: hypothetical protein AAGI23_01995 [Bacteroidota bacterium]